MKDAKGHGSNPHGAHAEGTNQIGKAPLGGRTVREAGWPLDTVNIFRAMPATASSIRPNDYVTRSEKFANGHADHMTATDEPSHVIKARVSADHVREAYNPGEYFYVGPEVKGAETYKGQE
jgi:hypothetical protein